MTFTLKFIKGHNSVKMYVELLKGIIRKNVG